MVFRNQTISLDELKKAVAQSYPGIEQRLKSTFIQHDIVGDDELPYDVVESLLRHFFLECGLDECMRKVTNAEGRLPHSRIASYLVGTTLEDLSDANHDHMIKSEEMVTLAVVWFKVLSDVFYRGEYVKPLMCGGGFCYGGSTPSHETEVAQEVGTPTFTNEVATPVVEVNPDVVIDEPQYTEYVNTEMDTVQLAQKNVNHYIQTLVNEAAANRRKGVKCFVYSSEMTANGACISAGAAVPQRKERAQSRRRATTGCC
ncbi:uncharacterized protein BXIN_2790 [Babesia sp. Xinjiang]|uniref:uncharacterized protein n=1 Tax=Babesia sp. Xinjiang TaxID=462227 RepID=UPI000A236DDD|nr:uncharacterized protein BXIN_2790 [Babesia sp. Xinjiang]ORM41757.1 hypothetical protein BXIN_2790 [Babesia sp. Xinjiang]